jgi:proteic killer suppression protein
MTVPTRRPRAGPFLLTCGAWRSVSSRKLDSADRLDDLRSPPGNRLESLSGGRSGQHSIRINEQYRICFTWTADGADSVEIVDYH